ncbi:MAG: CYTH domain-containing protein, partial [Planctomycetota bacterium]
MKLRVGSAAEASALLERLPATPEEARAFEDNDIYDTPDGAFFLAHRLLRLRTVGDRGLITYKE